LRHRPVERRRPRGARLAVGAGGGSAYEVDGLEDLDEVLVYLNESAAAAVVDPRKRLPVPGGVCVCAVRRDRGKKAMSAYYITTCCSNELRCVLGWQRTVVMVAVGGVDDHCSAGYKAIYDVGQCDEGLCECSLDDARSQPECVVD